MTRTTMLRIPLALAAVVVIVAPMASSSLTARAQAAPGVEYLRVASYATFTRATSANSVLEQRGYRACVATEAEWRCRNFEAPNPSNRVPGTPNEALRTALATLGAEGWELVSAVNEDTNAAVPLGVVYLFKRQVR